MCDVCLKCLPAEWRFKKRGPEKKLLFIMLWREALCLTVLFYQHSLLLIGIRSSNENCFPVQSGLKLNLNCQKSILFGCSLLAELEAASISQAFFKNAVQRCVNLAGVA